MLVAFLTYASLLTGALALCGLVVGIGRKLQEPVEEKTRTLVR